MTGTILSNTLRKIFLPSAVALGLLGSVFGTADANRSDLVAFLERTEKMSQPSGFARADFTIELEDGKTESGVLIVDPERSAQFIALKSSGWRSLSPLSWETGTAVKASGKKPSEFGADERIGETDLRPIDAFAFWSVDFSSAYISDSTKNEKTVMLYAPDNHPYELYVLTFNKEKLVPVVSKYFKDSMSNLVRIRKDSDHVMVGARLRPQVVAFEDYDENRSSKVRLTWKKLAEIPAELFDKATFATAEIDWPEPTTDAESAGN